MEIYRDHFQNFKKYAIPKAIQADDDNGGGAMIDYRNEDCMIGMARYPDKYFDLAIDTSQYVRYNICEVIL